MGYSAMQSGLVLFPGGMVVLMLMPVVGWMLNRDGVALAGGIRFRDRGVRNDSACALESGCERAHAGI